MAHALRAQAAQMLVLESQKQCKVRGRVEGLLQALDADARAGLARRHTCACQRQRTFAA
jgi:hypothetical protein